MSTNFEKLFFFSCFCLLTLVTAFSVSAQETQLPDTSQQIIESKDAQSSSISKNLLKESRPAFGLKRTPAKSADTAKADPLPPSSSYSWTGAYVGGHYGYTWGQGDTRFNPLPDAATFINLAPTTLKPDPKGHSGGVQGGYNWQSGYLVVGGEADFAWARVRGSRTVTPIVQNNGTPFPGAGFLFARQQTDWIGTVRGRAGAAFDRVLVYGTGGLAYGRVVYDADSDFRPFGTVHYPALFTRTKAGWTAGGGVEVGVTSHFSIKGEYRYYDLGNESFTANPSSPLPPFQVRYDWETKGQSVIFGANFRF